MHERRVAAMRKGRQRGFALGGLMAWLLVVSASPAGAQKPAVAKKAVWEAPARYKTIYTADPTTHRVTEIDMGSREIIREVELGGPPSDLAVTADGQVLFVLTRQPGAVWVIDATSFQVATRIPAGCESCDAMALAPVLDAGGIFSGKVKELWAVDRQARTVSIVSLEATGANRPFQLVETLRFEAAPSHVAFHPSGRWAYLSFPASGTVEVLDTLTHSRLAAIPLAGQPAFLAASPDGQQLWGVDAGSGRLFVLDTTVSEIGHRYCVCTLMAQVEVGGRPQRVHFVDRGTKGIFAYVTVAGTDEVVVVEATTRKVVKRIPVEPAPLGVWAAPSQRVVFVGHRGSNALALIQVGSDQVVAKLPVGRTPALVTAAKRSPLQCIAWGAVCPLPPEIPEGEAQPAKLIYVADQESSTITVIDGLSFEVLAEINVPGQAPSALAVTPDGQILFVANRVAGGVSVIDAATYQVLMSIPVCKRCADLELTPDGKELWVVDSEASQVAVIDLLNPEADAPFPVVARIGTGKAPSHVWFSPDNQQAYVSVQQTGTVEVFDRETRQRLATIPVGKSPTSLRTSPGSLEVWGVMTVRPKSWQLWGVNAGGRELFVIDVSRNERLATVEVGERPQSVQFVENGSGELLAYVTVRGSNEVVVVDAKALKVVGRIPVGKGPRGIWTSPDRKFAYVGHEGANEVYVIEAETGTVVAKVSVGKQPAVVLAR